MSSTRLRNAQMNSSVKAVVERIMDLTEAKRLLTAREHSRSARIDIRNGIQEGLARQVPGLVAEVERLKAKIGELKKAIPKS